MAQWADVDFGELFTNPDETLLQKQLAALENGYVNEAKGASRFPGRKRFATLPGNQTYLFDWRDDLIATTNEGRVYRVNQTGNAIDVTGVPVSGGRRPTFTKTEEDLLIAAGGPIIRLQAGQTEVLSEDAPETTHVAFLDGYVVAIEPYSGRAYHSAVGLYTQWDPLDVFTAEGKPDDLIAMVVTPYRELLLAGNDSIEQFERLASGTTPFFRRWATGEGLYAPYSLLAVDNGTYGLNPQREFVRFTQQVSRPESDEISASLERVDDWDEAWAAQIHIKGQRFILLQAPKATNIYGTTGITALFDYRARRWSHLYDFDESQGTPKLWLPRSYHPLWGRHFLGVPGGIEELHPDEFCNCGETQRFLLRTGHIGQFGPSRCDDFRLRIKRGIGSYDQTVPEPKIGVRVNRDNRGFGRIKWKGLGRPGQRELILSFGPMGQADTWQFEFVCTDQVAVEIAGAQMLVERLRR